MLPGSLNLVRSKARFTGEGHSRQNGPSGYVGIKFYHWKTPAWHRP